jgi:hypothetical protein
MRHAFLNSMIARALVWTAAGVLATPMAVAQEASLPSPKAGGVSDVPLAAVSGTEEADCELVNVKQGESPKIVEKKTVDNGKEFVFLQSQDMLLEEFRVEGHDDCGVAFGFFPGGAQAAAGGAAGGGAAAGGAAAGATVGAGVSGTLAGVGIGAAVGIGIAGAAAAGVLAATVAGRNNSTATTSTTDPNQN